MQYRFIQMGVYFADTGKRSAETYTIFSPERSCTQTPGRTLKLVERPPCRGVRAREFEACGIRIARSGLTACSQLHAETLVHVMRRPWRLCQASRRLSSNSPCLQPLIQSVSQIRDQRPALATRNSCHLETGRPAEPMVFSAPLSLVAICC